VLGCPLGLDCDRKAVLSDAKCYAINCDNYFYCRSWVLPWSLPLHRITAQNPLKFDSVGQDYYLVQFLNVYGYPGEQEIQGMQERDWAAYFAEYGYAEAVPLSNFEELIHYKPRRFPVTLANCMTMVMTVFDAIMTIRRRD
jgi:hypothetical protein